MVELNGFRLTVPESINESSDGYIDMEHNKVFSIRLYNRHMNNGTAKPCDATVFVNGIDVGTFRVQHGQYLIVERPINDTGRFTAIKAGTSEAVSAGIDEKDENVGLIKVIFRPGIHAYTIASYSNNQTIPIPDYQCSYDNIYNNGGYTARRCSMRGSTNSMNHSFDNASSVSCGASMNYSAASEPSQSYSGGGIGLSEESSQIFSSVGSLIYDEPATTLYLRVRFPEKSSTVRPIKHQVYMSGYPRPLKR
jgi:hypothetical protein